MGPRKVGRYERQRDSATDRRATYCLPHSRAARDDLRSLGLHARDSRMNLFLKLQSLARGTRETDRSSLEPASLTRVQRASIIARIKYRNGEYHCYYYFFVCKLFIIFSFSFLLLRRNDCSFSYSRDAEPVQLRRRY